MKKYSTALSGSQAAFCATAASAIREAASAFETSNSELASQHSKFLGQIQLFLHATDSTVMLPQLKLALSARPATTLNFGENPEQHPIHVTIRYLSQLFFDHAPRTIIKDLLRLLTFLMTPVPGTEIAPNTVCAFTRAQFSAGWQSTLKAMQFSSSLLLEPEIDPENADHMTKINAAVESLDILWSILSANTPSIIPLFDDLTVVNEVWSFLTRMAQLSSRDQRQELASQIFSQFVVESYLASVHAFIKLHPLRERLLSDYTAMMATLELDLDNVVEQTWFARDHFSKIYAESVPRTLDAAYHGSSIQLFGALFHATISHLCSRHCTKETTQSAGMLVAVLSAEILVSLGRTFADWIQTQFVLSFLPSFATTPSLAQYSIFNALPSGPQLAGPGSEPYERHIFSPQFVDAMPLVAIQSVIRGLLVCFQSHVGLLIAPCASLREIRHESSEASTATDSPSTGVPVVTVEPSSILFDAALTWFLRNAEASHDRNSRLIGVRSAGTCVDVLLKALNNETLNDSKVVSQYLKGKVEASMERLFELIWKNWEDPFDSIVSEICLMFPLLLDVAERACQIFGASANLGPDFVDKLALHLLNVDPSTKGKYPLLNLLVQRIGPARLLQLKPSFVEDLFKASSYGVAGRSVGPCIQSMLHAIHAIIQPGSRDKKKSKDKKAPVEQKPASTWTVDPISLFTLPIVASLLDVNTQMPITAYALPAAFELFPATFSSTLRFLTSDIAGKPIQEFDLLRIKAILSVLKVGRSTGLIENSALLHPDFFASSSPALQGLLPRLIGEAITSNDIFCRVDALQLLTETRKLSELPVSLELESLLRNIEYNMVETSLTYRNRATGVLDQLMTRLKDSMKHHFKLPARSLPAQQTLARDSKNAVAFINELSSALLHCLYSSAPPHRRLTALESLRSLVTKFGPNPAKGCNFVPYVHLSQVSDDVLASAAVAAQPDSDAWKHLEIFSPAATLSLLVGLWDQYDSARTLSFEVLKQYPAPLPGFETADSLKPLLRWILNSISSPRMREADAGSLALRLIISTYIVRSGWTLRMQLNTQGDQLVGHVDALPPPATGAASVTERLVAFCNDLLNIVQVHIAETRKSRQYAAMHFPVHGPLMAVRYLVNDVNVASLDAESTRHWRELVVQIMQVSKSVSALALELKYPLRYTHNEMGEVDHSRDHDNGDDGDDEDAIEPELAVPAEAPKESDGAKPAQKDSSTGGTTEGVIVAMWLSLKEVSFLIGCLVKSCVTAATADFAASLKSTTSSAAAAAAVSISTPLPLTLITSAEIRELGQHLLDNLLVLRHRGAMETTAEGFQAICEAILSTNDRSLHTIVHTWLAQLLTRIDNTPWALLSTRRSAGLPHAFLSILRSETNARASRTFLPIVFSHLLATASRTSWSSQASQDAIAEKIAHAKPEDEEVHIPEVAAPSTATGENDADVGKGTEANYSPKEHRHQVHAFNVIRAIIRDRNVVYDASPFVEPVLTLVLQLYHSPHWAVQNAATMAFSTLLERTAGGSRLANLSSGSAAEESSLTPTSSRRTPKFTAVEFFARYPIAHAYLTAALANATTAETSSNPQLIARMLHKVTESKLLPAIHQLHTSISQITETHKEVNPWSSASADEESSHSASLYAVLLLLSRMSPSKSASTSHQQANLEPMILLTCSAAVSSQNSKVRILASKALAPLISTPAMPVYVQSLIDALPNSPEEYSAYSGEDGAANQLHGLLYLILQLLRTHMHVLATVAANQSQERNESADGDAAMTSDASFTIASASLLEQLRSTVLPSILPKLWLLRSKAAPIAVVLLSILTEFVIDPLCTDASLAKTYPNFATLATSTTLISALHLRRKGTELATAKVDDSVQAVMEDVMVHRQYKFYSNILIKAHLQLSEHLELASAHLGAVSTNKSISSIQATLEVLMSFPYYEVRLQAYKLLIAHIDSPLISHERLGERLLQHLGFLASSESMHVETHSKCILRVIRLLNALGERGALADLLEKSETINPQKIFAVLQHWAHYEPMAVATGTPISRYCKTSTLQETVDESGVSSSLRQEALGFLSFFLRSYQKTCKSKEEYESMLTWWLDTIERHSRYDLASTDRTAAIVALNRHPLKFSEVTFSNLVVDYWMLVVRSLQDDEAEEREVARQTASCLLISERNTLTASTAEPAHAVKLNAEPGLISCTLACYEYLTLNVPTLPHYWRWLLTGLCPRLTESSGGDLQAELQTKLAFSSQLFEQEKANFFHEPALISQICRDHLLRIATKAPKDVAYELKSVLEPCKAEIETNFIGLVSFMVARVPNPETCNVSQLIAEWQCMYDQLFAPLYSHLIGLQTLQCIYPAPAETGKTNQGPVETALLQLTEGKAGLLHPVLAGLAYRIPSLTSLVPCFAFTSAVATPITAPVDFPSDVPKLASTVDSAIQALISKTQDAVAHSVLESVSTELTASGVNTAPLSPTDTWSQIFDVKAIPTNFLLPRPAVSLR